jgi:hypothetical protein
VTPLLVVPRPALAIPAWTPPPPPRSLRCTHPFCGERAAHRHHTVARSQQRSILGIRDALDWLEINGELVCVVTDLCSTHHDKLESGYGGCKARLRWAAGWIWYDRADILPEDEVYEKAGIWWFDRDTKTAWRMRGFLRGNYSADEDR